MYIIIKEAFSSILPIHVTVSYVYYVLFQLLCYLYRLFHCTE